MAKFCIGGEAMVFNSKSAWRTIWTACAVLMVQGCNSINNPQLSDDGEENAHPSLLGSLSKRREPKRPPRMEGGQVNLPSRSTGNSAMKPIQNMDNSFSKVESNVWRSSLPASQAYQAVSRVISQNYIIAQADKSQMTISTEWDKFFIDGRLFRNRINASVFPVSSRATEIVIRNSVEYYATDSKSSDIREANWFPTPDVTDEVSRIVEGLSRYTSNLARSQAQENR